MRFGGAGACFPLRFVVRRICTMPLFDCWCALVNVVNFVTILSGSSEKNGIKSKVSIKRQPLNIYIYSLLFFHFVFLNMEQIR